MASSPGIKTEHSINRNFFRILATLPPYRRFGNRPIRINFTVFPLTPVTPSLVVGVAIEHCIFDHVMSASPLPRQSHPIQRGELLRAHCSQGFPWFHMYDANYGLFCFETEHGSILRGSTIDWNTTECIIEQVAIVVLDVCLCCFGGGCLIKGL